MNRKIIIISIVTLFIISGVVLAGNARYEEATNLGKKYEISGVIKDTDGNNVSECTIQLIGANTQNTIEIQDSNFKFENLSEGQYKLKLKYDMTKFELESITYKKEEVYSLASDYSICFMYPETSDEITHLVNELSNKLMYINRINSFRKIKIYEIKYNEQEDLELATKKIMQDTRNLKVIVAFANNKEFLDICKEKQEYLGVLQNVSRSSPYRILGIYLNGNIEQYMDELYDNFFIGYNGELNKQSILDKIYELYNNNITKIVSSREERVNLNFTQNTEYIETENIQISNGHDNDTTNSIEIILKKKDDTNQITNPTVSPPDEPNINEQPQIEQENIQITVPSSEPDVSNKTIEISITKKVVAINLVLSDGTVFINESVNNGGINWSIPSSLKVISLDEELMHGATIQIEYEIQIENKSNEFDLKNVVLWDCLNYHYNNNIVYNQNLELLTNTNMDNDSQNWESIRIGEKDCLKTTIDEIKKEESKTKRLVLSKIISVQEDEMYYENHAMLESLSYENNEINGQQTITTVTEQDMKDNTLTNVVKSPNIIIIPPTGKR